MCENRRFASIADLADWLKQKDLMDEEIDAVKSKLWEDGRRSVYSLVGVKADDLKGMGISSGLALTLENALLRRKVQSCSKRQKLALDGVKAFDIFHLKGVLVDESWQDQERGFTFKGRNRFVENVQSYLCGHLTSEAPAKRRAKALVYSSVSGTGKTVSMLELKRLLSKEDNDRCVVVSYLGFNCCLGLLKEELDHMLSNANFVDGAKEVLARRLAASTIISLNNPNEVSSLPLGENVYKGYVIPNVAESKQLLLDGTKATESSPVYIVAGVDEVQLLNNDVPNGPGLGSLFLRILREWQHEWYIDGIRLLPLGTGIAIDWAADPTLGSNISIHGSDTTLISKEDFKSLVQDAVVVLKNNNKFVKLFGATIDTDTVIDVVSSAYWPRVRLVEFLKNGDMDILNERAVDKNGGEHWLTWLCHWMRDEDIPSDHDAIPGKGNGEGNIYTLFTLAKGGKFCVIPDGYTSSSLVRALKKDLNVPGLYGNLDVVKSLQPDEFMLTNADDFDKLAFHVVGTSLHAGIYAISQSEMDLSLSGANCKQKRRLGLALWFLSKGAITHSDSQIIVPKVLGKATSLALEDDDFYPFSTKEQIDFLKDVRESLSDNTLCPVYIRCGRRAICDYLYFYHCKSDGSANSELICMIGDGKHSCKDAKSICSSDQEQLFKALRCVASAMEASELRLKFVRLVFVTNKTKLAIGKPGSEAMLALERQKTDAETLFPHTNQELLNLGTFEFSPFSDILSAKRSYDGGDEGRGGRGGQLDAARRRSPGSALFQSKLHTDTVSPRTMKALVASVSATKNQEGTEEDPEEADYQLYSSIMEEEKWDFFQTMSNATLDASFVGMDGSSRSYFLPTEPVYVSLTFCNPTENDIYVKLARRNFARGGIHADIEGCIIRDRLTNRAPMVVKKLSPSECHTFRPRKLCDGQKPESKDEEIRQSDNPDMVPYWTPATPGTYMVTFSKWKQKFPLVIRTSHADEDAT